ncbi:hypothetical protein RCL1_005364 [Eukaryota sp. TZLM3-RCL]
MSERLINRQEDHELTERKRTMGRTEDDSKRTRIEDDLDEWTHRLDLSSTQIDLIWRGKKSATIKDFLKQFVYFNCDVPNIASLILLELRSKTSIRYNYEDTDVFVYWDDVRTPYNIRDDFSVDDDTERQIYREYLKKSDEFTSGKEIVVALLVNHGRTGKTACFDLQLCSPALPTYQTTH